jgi:hypothetical protein
LEIQALLDGGGVVSLGPGVYDTCGMLIVPSNTHFRGAGRGITVIRGGPTVSKIVAGSLATGTISTVGTTNVTISDLTVDHAACNRWANGIAAFPAALPGEGIESYNGTPATNVVIRDVEVIGVPGNHNYMVWALKARHVKILNSWIDGRTPAGAPKASQEGIEAYGGWDVQIRGNTVKNIGNACFLIGSAEGLVAGVNAVTVADNYGENCGVGVDLGSSQTVSGHANNLVSVKVTSNTFVNARYNGIQVFGRVGATIRDLLIAQNTIQGVGAQDGVSAGITLRSIGAPIEPSNVEDVEVSRNNIDVAGLSAPGNTHGIRIIDFHNTRIADNTIRNAPHTAIFAVNAQNLEVADNKIEGAGQSGIALHGNSAPYANFAITGNRIRWNGLSAGILLLNGQRGVVAFNRFFREDGVLTGPVVTASGTCDVQILNTVHWYYPAWSSGVVPPCQ